MSDGAAGEDGGRRADTPRAVEEFLGEPTRVTTEGELRLVTWTVGGSALTLGFGPPLPPVIPPMTSGSTTLRLLLLHRASEAPAPAPSPTEQPDPPRAR